MEDIVFRGVGIMRFITFCHNIKDAAKFNIKLKSLGIKSKIKLNYTIEEEDLIYDFILVILENSNFQLSFEKGIREYEKDNLLYSVYSSLEEKINILDIKSMLNSKAEVNKIAFIPSEPLEEYLVIGGYINKTKLSNKTQGSNCINIWTLLNNDFKGNFLHISLEEIYKGKDNVLEKIKAEDKIIDFFDGTSMEDIEYIANAIKEISQNYYYIASGSFLIKLFQALNKASWDKNKAEEKVLILSSSKSLAYMEKLKDFMKVYETELYNLNLYSLITHGEEEKKRAINYLMYNNKTNYVAITTAMAKEDIVNLQDFSLRMNVEEEVLKEKIEISLVEIARRLLEMDEKITCIICNKYSTVMNLLKELKVFSFEFNAIIFHECYSITIDLEERRVHILVDFEGGDSFNSIEDMYKSYKYSNKY